MAQATGSVPRDGAPPTSDPVTSGKSPADPRRRPTWLLEVLRPPPSGLDPLDPFAGLFTELGETVYGLGRR